ncbi:hypothetical protein [Nocardiopsis algeriensis]|uniref:Lipoprotein n=1 Tax=Nocardiopsis algeriensis TaxID=1478215 RepID=A0A841IXM0_9ACTN|nr:hypothetical protein [Nocardiopsis algeriensis]MBB6120978.1 hypothetical protein [Nocardiopsis algeriensis]
MRHGILIGLCTSALLAATACGEEEQAPSPSETRDVQPEAEESGAPTAEESPQDTGGAYVLNRYGDEEGFDDRRPREYVSGEFTTFTDMEWDEWSGERARGEGEVLGSWCLDQGCQDDPYDVEVELTDPVEVDGTPYFSQYTITEYDDDMPEEMRQALEDADGGRLDVPVGR